MSNTVNQFSREQTQRSLNIVATWVHALLSGSNINPVLSDICELVGADGIQVVRHMRHTDTIRLVADYEISAGKLFSKAMRSYIPLIFGDVIHIAKAGSIWLFSELDHKRETHEVLEELKTKEVVVLPLGTGDDHSDFLEMHLSATFQNRNRTFLEILAPILSQTWGSRAPGSVEALLAGRPFPITQATPAIHQLLTPDNPVGLTRSEFRICSLIQEGNMPDQISAMLSVKRSTVKSHMHAIYQKTGTSGHVDLVHRLRNSRSFEHQAVG